MASFSLLWKVFLTPTLDFPECGLSPLLLGISLVDTENCLFSFSFYLPYV